MKKNSEQFKICREKNEKITNFHLFKKKKKSHYLCPKGHGLSHHLTDKKKITNFRQLITKKSTIKKNEILRSGEPQFLGRSDFRPWMVIPHKHKKESGGGGSRNNCFCCGMNRKSGGGVG